MANLPTDSIQRIADARRNAECELKVAISAIPETDDVASYLPAVTSFASALFDAEADELLPVSNDAQEFQTALENEVAPRIIEGILPDRSLDRVSALRTDEVARLSVEHEMDTDLIWEVAPDGTRKPARAEICGVYAQHGDWEHFLPKGVRFLVRWRGNNAAVRAAICQTLQQRVDYWAGQFHIRATARNYLRRPLAELPPATEHAQAGKTEAGPAQKRRLQSTVTNEIAARRMEAYLTSSGIGQTEFAATVGTTDRTLRAFRKTGKVRRHIFDAIAKGMGTSREALLNPEKSTR